VKAAQLTGSGFLDFRNDHVPATVRIAARSAVTLRLPPASVLRVIDVEGKQVADVFAVAALDPRDRLSCIVTLAANLACRLAPGYILYTSRRRALLTVTEDTVGCHDLFVGACSSASYAARYGDAGRGHLNCQDLLRDALAGAGVDTEISDTLNVFMNVPLDATGRFRIEEPLSRAGDSLGLRAEQECIIAISACPADLSPCNGWDPTPIDVEVFPRGTDYRPRERSGLRPRGGGRLA
jgi:uncharacterized protein YcgI (DUF1989 family)